jgi:hypothetical protein
MEGRVAMTSIYWYEKDPELLEAEKTAMRKYLPHFKLAKLDDGRLYWYGKMRPSRTEGREWTLMAIYAHNHPSNNTFGGSIRVYSVEPDLNELYAQKGRLPHVLRDTEGDLYMCTARREDFNASQTISSSAASSLAWAGKWIFAVELWLDGLQGDEIFDHTF